MNFKRIIFFSIIMLFCISFCLTAQESETEESNTDSTTTESSSDNNTTVKKRKSNKSGDQRMMLTAGGGLAINVPAIDIIHDGYIDWNTGDTKTNTFIAFGFNVMGNVTFTYQLDNEWSLGGSVNLGYNFMGGPHAHYEVRYKNETYTNLYRGMGKLYHSFLADFNFMARTPAIMKGMDLILEGGVRLMPTWSFLVYRENGVTKIGENAYSYKQYPNPYTGAMNTFAYPGKEATMMAGPNLFVGIDYFINDYFDVIGGLRIGAAFGCANSYYINNGIYTQSYLNSIITIALEAKFNWYRKF